MKDRFFLVRFICISVLMSTYTFCTRLTPTSRNQSILYAVHMQGPRNSVGAAAAAVAWSIIATKHKQQSSNGGEANSVNTSKRFKHNRRCGLRETRAAHKYSLTVYSPILHKARESCMCSDIVFGNKRNSRQQTSRALWSK